MIRAVLFDLDDTLLDINLSAFILRYAIRLSKLIGQVARVPSPVLYPAIAYATLTVNRQDRTDSFTNAELFNRLFFEETGIPLDDPVIADVVTTYEREIVPHMSGGIVAAEPRPGMREAVEQVHNLGLVCGLASNPLFSLDVDRARMSWAGVSEDDFALITTSANSHRTKPHADYYYEFLAPLGLEPRECLMVGNDAKRDFPRPDIGLRTIYVGHARPSRALWIGRPERLARDLKTIIDYANEQDA